MCCCHDAPRYVSSKSEASDLTKVRRFGAERRDGGNEEEQIRDVIARANEIAVQFPRLSNT
jgi:hypothetical protein